MQEQFKALKEKAQAAGMHFNRTSRGYIVSYTLEQAEKPGYAVHASNEYNPIIGLDILINTVIKHAKTFSPEEGNKLEAKCYPGA